MKSFFFAAAAAAPAAALTPEEYLTWTADSFIRKGVEKDYHYSKSVLYSGFQAAIDVTDNQTLVDWYRSQIDGAVVSDQGTMVDWNLTHYSLDDYRIGNDLLYWHERTGEDKYKAAADMVRHQLDRHPQNGAGGFWHRAPIYAHQMWLDGLFMADTFYARWTAAFDKDNTTAWDHIVTQFDNVEAHCRNATSGLLVHGYDDSKTAVWADPVTGAAPNVWSRAVGWYVLALLEVIPRLPAAHAGRAKLTRYFTTLAAAIRAHQDASSGGWWLVMNEPYPGAAGNYIESSASAMFTYALLQGMRDGYLAEADYRATATRGFALLTRRFVAPHRDDGTMSWEGTVAVGSLNSPATYEYYIGVPRVTDDLKGVGPFMLASQPHLHSG